MTAPPAGGAPPVPPPEPVGHVTEWAKNRRGQIAELAGRGAVVLQPVGSIEQHGPHLPIDTDTTIATAVSLRAAGRSHDHPLVVLPTVCWGLSPYWMGYPGTLSLRSATFTALVTDIAAAVRHHGFDRLVLVNAHGGNAGLLDTAAAELSDGSFRVASVSCTRLASEVIVAECDRDGPGAGHSGQMETSVVLHLDPDRVAPELPGPEECNDIGVRATHVGHVPSYLAPHPEAEAPSGVYGQAWAASEDKGERIIDASSSALARFGREFASAYRGRPAAGGGDDDV